MRFMYWHGNFGSTFKYLKLQPEYVMHLSCFFKFKASQTLQEPKTKDYAVINFGRFVQYHIDDMIRIIS